jgi:hypothetical protein
MARSARNKGEERNRARRYFIHAPPIKGVGHGGRESKRKQPLPPYKGAPPMQCSVYYWWWEFLKRHEGYKETCLNGGKGEYAELYRELGNVHEGGFWQWWKAHLHLFDEPLPPVAKVISKDALADLGDDMLLIAVPKSQRLPQSMGQIKRALLAEGVKKGERLKPSEAVYKVHSKPVLSGLYDALRVWDAYKLLGNVSLYLIADYVDGKLSEAEVRKYDAITSDKEKRELIGDAYHRGAKSLFVWRNIRIAQQYIDNLPKKIFPFRTHR